MTMTDEHLNFTPSRRKCHTWKCWSMKCLNKWQESFRPMYAIETKQNNSDCSLRIWQIHITYFKHPWKKNVCSMFVHVSALSDLTLFMRAWLGCERRRKFIPWIQTITYVDVINNSAFEYAQYENCVRLLTHDANISWNSYSVAIRAIQMSWRFDCIELRSVHVNA